MVRFNDNEDKPQQSINLDKDGAINEFEGFTSAGYGETDIALKSINNSLSAANSTRDICMVPNLNNVQHVTVNI